MPTWNNWSGRLSAKPKKLHFVRSEEDAAAYALQAQQTGQTIRVAGSGHSHANLIPNNTMILDCSGLNGIVSTNVEQRTATVRAGTPIYAMGLPLLEAGLALHNQGDIDRQSIAGAVATGTHGTGPNLSNLSARVIGAQLACASGELLEVTEQSNPNLWQATRLNLGALGIVTQLTLQLREAFRLQERSWQLDADALTEAIEEYPSKSRHFEFFYYPQKQQAEAKSLSETDAPAQYPLGAEGERCSWSHEVLPNYRPHLHTEMEYSVPAAVGAECFHEIRMLLQNDFPQVQWPVEVRTLAADDVWLSPAYQRETITISVHQDVKQDETEYYRACEAIFKSFGGRPHWGKVNYLTGADFATSYPQWHLWWDAQKAIDPNGVFLNPYLQALKPTA